MQQEQQERRENEEDDEEEEEGREHQPQPIEGGTDQLQRLHVEMSESEGDSDEDNSEGLADDASHGRATANEDGSGEDNSEVPIDAAPKKRAKQKTIQPPQTRSKDGRFERR